MSEEQFLNGKNTLRTKLFQKLHILLCF